MNIVPAFIRKKIDHRPNLLKIVDNIGWLFFDKVLRMGMGLLVGVWVARYLGPEQFGLFNYAHAFVALFGAIAGLGIQGIVVRDIVRDPLCKEETLGTAAVLQFAGGLIAYGLILSTIFWLRSEDMLAKVLVAILGSSMLFKASEVTVYWFESQVQSKYTVWIQNGVFVIFAAIKIGLILSEATLITFAWATTAEGLLVALLMSAMLGLQGPKLRQLRISLARTKTLLKQSWPLMLSGITISIYMKIDQIMLGQMLGDEAVGIFSAAMRISEIWYFLPIAIVASVSPAIIQTKKRSEEQYYRRIQHLFDLMVWLSIGIALPTTFLSTSVVTMLFGEAYSESGPVLAIHIWSSVFVFLGIASNQWLLAENRQILSLQRTALGAAVNVILNLLLMPQYGAVGAAIATVTAQFIVGFMFDVFQKETRRMFTMKLNAMNLSRIFRTLKKLQ